MSRRQQGSAEGLQKLGKPEGAGGQRLWCGAVAGAFVLGEGLLLLRSLEASPVAPELVLLLPGFGMGILRAG